MAVRVSDSLRIAQRAYLSVHHLRSTLLFAGRVKDIESTFDGKFDDHRLGVHASYAAASLCTCAFFLEALVNEVFADAADGEQLTCLAGVDSSVVERLAAAWRIRKGTSGSLELIDRLPVLDKYDIAAALCGRAFQKGETPYQEVALVFDIRNALVHPKPETVTIVDTSADGAVTTQTVEKRLHGKFSLNPLVTGAPFFPMKCLGLGCAKWALSAGVRFADVFATMLGSRKLPYTDYRSQVNTFLAG